MSVVLNPGHRPAAVRAPGEEALAFHRALPGYAPTPVHDLPALAAQAGAEAVLVKDESDRLGLPAFKVLGASWAVERTLRAAPGTRTLVAASAGNHGRAVARVAAQRGLACRVLLPARADPVRRAAIAGEGAEVVVVDGDYEDAVARAEAEGERPGVAVVADVGASPCAHWVVDGYATLFAEAAEQARADLLVVPAGVGSLAAAAARHAARAGIALVVVEPVTARCVAASLAHGAPVRVPTPGTTMAGLDCAEVSPAAWPDLRDGVRAAVAVRDEQAHAAMADLEAAGLRIGEAGAAPLAALRVLAAQPDLVPEVRGRVLLVATEGRTGPQG